MGIEYEWKYRADPQVQACIYQKTEGFWQEIAMETTYYDTEDGALSRLGCTLRRRMENEKSICTLKTPAADGGRGEWEVEADAIEQAVEELCKLGAPKNLLALTAGGVQPICGAKFLRRACSINIGTAVVELALDEGVLTGGRKEIPLCEIEVELKGGALEAAAAFGARLADECGLVPETKSKFRRALDLTKEK